MHTIKMCLNDLFWNVYIIIFLLFVLLPCNKSILEIHFCRIMTTYAQWFVKRCHFFDCHTFMLISSQIIKYLSSAVTAYFRCIPDSNPQFRPQPVLPYLWYTPYLCSRRYRPMHSLPYPLYFSLVLTPVCCPL